MEQITKREGKIFYGQRKCANADEAYRRFRDEYHNELGKKVFQRLNRRGRKERIHEYGFVFSVARQPPEEVGFCRIRYRLFSVIGISYCRIVSGWDMPEMDDDLYEEWFDWAFSRGSGALILVGRKDGYGRKQYTK